MLLLTAHRHLETRQSLAEIDQYGGAPCDGDDTLALTLSFGAAHATLPFYEEGAASFSPEFEQTGLLGIPKAVIFDTFARTRANAFSLSEQLQHLAWRFPAAEIHEVKRLRLTTL